MQYDKLEKDITMLFDTMRDLTVTIGAILDVLTLNKQVTSDQFKNLLKERTMLYDKIIKGGKHGSE